jgi:flagellar protein FlaG
MYDGKVAHGGEGMAMDSYVKGVTIDFDAKAAEGAKVSAPKEAVKSEKSSDKEGEKNLFRIGEDKEPAKSTIDSAISGMNARLPKTHCAYAYDEDTKRITIKVFDDETEELIREVPPEKSLEVLKKVWEIAGIIIDEKG